MNLALALLSCCLSVAIRAQDATTTSTTWSFKGRVVDPMGKPISDAGFTAGSRDRYLTVDALEHPIAKTRPDGTFTLQVGALEGVLSFPRILVAAPGRAAGVLQISSDQLTGTVDLGDIVLPSGTTHHGRIRGANGKPLAGARIACFDLIAARTWYYSLGKVTFASTANSGADGIFTIPCALSEAVEVLVRAEGHATQRISPMSQGQPLDIALSASGFVEGKLLSPDGKPVAGDLRIEYEVDPEERQMLQADANGRFRASLRHIGRYRVSSWSSPQWESGDSPVLDKPARDVEVRTVPPGKRVVVRAVSAASGSAIKSFRVRSWALQYGNGGVSDDLLGGWNGESVQDGQWRFPVGLDGRSGKGPLQLSVEGYAPVTIPEVDLDQDGTILVEARLGRESTVEGRVIDDKTGKALGGVPISCKESGADRGERRRRSRGNAPPENRTAADGSFRIGSLGKGTFDVQAGDSTTPFGAKVTVVLAEGETKTGILLKAPGCATIVAKVANIPIRPNWSLRLFPGDDRVDPYSSWYETSPEMVEVGVDASGSFRIENKLPGDYQLHLVIPGAPRTGLDMIFSLEKLRVDAADQTRVIDPDEATPAVLKGKVVFNGTSLQPGRFVVNAIPTVHTRQKGLMTWSSLPSDVALVGRYALIGADGGYELGLSPGDYELQILDVETGVALHREKNPLKPKAKGDIEKDFTIDVIPITVRLDPLTEGPVLAARLTIRAAVKPVDRMGNVSIDLDREGRGPGLALAGRGSEVSFFAPPGDVQLAVYSMANRLDRGPNRKHGSVSLGEAVLTAATNKPATVSIKVADPPPIEDDK